MSLVAHASPVVKGRILCLEDEEDDYLAFIAPLRELGWEVEWVSNAGDVVRHLQNPNFDIIISDRQWYDKAGRPLMLGDDHVKELYFRTRLAAVIVLTHYPDPTAVVKAMRYGAYDVLKKGERAGQETFPARLDEVCTRAVKAHWVRRNRQPLLRLSQDDLRKELAVLLSDVFNPNATPDWFRAQYVEVFNGESARICPMTPGSAGAAGGDQLVRVDELPGLRYVVDTLQPVYAPAPPPLPPGLSLGPWGRTRVLMPVLQDPNPYRSRRALLGVLWLEFATVLDPSDMQIIQDVAECLSDGMSITRERERFGAEQRVLEQSVLLADVATRVSTPLQAAQSRVDLLRARLTRRDEVPTPELLETVTAVHDLLEQAVQEAGWLRDAAARRFRRPAAVRLDLLVMDTASCLTRTEEIPLTVSAADPAVVRADADEARAAIRALLRSSAAHPGGGRVGVHIDPTGCNTVLVRALHPATDPAERTRLFDRTPSTARDHAALWPLAEFARAFGGEVAVHTAADGTSWVELVMPAATAGEVNK